MTLRNLPFINGRKNVKVDHPIGPAISFLFCTSSQQKSFPSTFQAIICLTSLSLSLFFYSRPISSESFSTEVRSVSHLDFQSSHNVHSGYFEMCYQCADCSASGIHTGKVWNNFLAALSLLSLLFLSLPPSTASTQPPGPTHTCCTTYLSPVWFGCRALRRWVGYASPCRLLCTLCSQGCLLCGPQASGLWRVEYHLLI